MANEVRLIDANAYPCQTCEVSYCYKNCGKFNAWFEKTVDAVEVVRCKDCRYFEIDPDDFLGICKCGLIATSYAGEIYPEREHFCSYGERREGE